MTEYPNLKNPPITEAVIDFRCIRSDTVSLEKLEGTQKILELGYYLKGPIIQAEFTVGSGSDPTQTESGLQTIGVRLHSHDEKYVIQWTLDGCALSRLEPYESWEKLNVEARRVWSLYVDAVKPIKISRTAVRYINNLQFAMNDGERFEDYLAAPPQIADGLPQTRESFLQRIVVREPSTSASGVITHAYDSKRRIDNNVSVILDIDAFSECAFNTKDDTVWHCLEQLRAFKNLIFFKNLKHKALSLYL